MCVYVLVCVISPLWGIWNARPWMSEWEPFDHFASCCEGFGKKHSEWILSVLIVMRLKEKLGSFVVSPLTLFFSDNRKLFSQKKKKKKKGIGSRRHKRHYSSLTLKWRSVAQFPLCNWCTQKWWQRVWDTSSLSPQQPKEEKPTTKRFLTF